LPEAGIHFSMKTAAYSVTKSKYSEKKAPETFTTLFCEEIKP
jgi:hypothetical protein